MDAPTDESGPDAIGGAMITIHRMPGMPIVCRIAAGLEAEGVTVQ